jgi:phage baseplate assembly protein W
MKSYNIKFPLSDDTEANKLFSMCSISKDAYGSDLMLLLLTDKGERYYQPDYGTNLNKFLFEPNDKITQEDIVSDIKRTVSIYIPSLTINNVIFKWDNNEGDMIDRGELELEISFTYSDELFSEDGKITINF